jgi:predicted metal-binding membrane protein
MIAGNRPDAPTVAGRDRVTLVTYVVLLLVTAAAWIQILSSAMQADDMAGMSMPLAPTLAEGALYVAAWTVMMAAMMLPSAAPMIGLYAATQRNEGSALVRLARVALFALTYLWLWALTGVPTYLASVALGAITAQALAYVVAGLLVAAGLFQLSPLKQVCLRSCRSPVGFLLGRWRSGWRGGLAMGWAHAAYCLGCCWALMAVLVVAGAMGLAWVLLIAAAVAAEKLLPRGEWIARAIGVALVLLGAAVAVRPDLAVALRGGGAQM